MSKQVAKDQAKTLAGKLYIVVRDPVLYDDDLDRYFIAGEFEVDEPSQFKKKLIQALLNFESDILDGAKSLAFNPAQDIYIVPQGWVSLEDLGLDLSEIFYVDSDDESV